MSLSSSLKFVGALSGFNFPVSAWLYGLRTLLAVGVALFAAFLFQLQESGVAATTVVILANPIHGLVLSKGLWRFFATLAGGIGSIVLVAIFIQMPELFIIALAVWSGIFTALGSFLKHFRVYAAALTGYTVAIITLQVVDDPLLIFDHTIDRIEAISIGIASAALVTGLFAPGTSSRRIEQEFSTIIAECLVVLGSPKASNVHHNKLMARLRAFDTLVEAALHEPSAGASRSKHYRWISQRLASLLMLDLIETSISPNVFVPVSIANFNDLGCHYAFLRSEAAAMNFERKDEQTDLLALLDLATTLAYEIAERLREKNSSVIGAVSFYSGDIRRAVLNGIRSAFGALTAGYYWIFSGAPYGASILSGVILTSCLLATADDPKKASMNFGGGVVVASVAAIAFTFCLLPRLTEFMLLIGGLGLFIIPGCLLGTRSRLTLFASGYLIFFMIFISLNNVATFDAVTVVNTEAGWVLGALYSVLLFRTLFPSAQAQVIAYHSRVLINEPERDFEKRKHARYEERVYHHAMQIGTRLDLNSFDRANAAFNVLKGAFIRIAVLRNSKLERS